MTKRVKIVLGVVAGVFVAMAVSVYLPTPSGDSGSDGGQTNIDPQTEPGPVGNS